MRPDSRSFSFTWLKGTQQSEREQQSSRPTTRSMLTSATTQDIHDRILKSVADAELNKQKKVNKKELYGCNPSKLKQLKEFGQSVFGQSSKENSKTRYSTIRETVTDGDDLNEDNEEEEDSDNEHLQDSDENNAPEVMEIATETEAGTADSFDKKSMRSDSSKTGIGKRLNQTVKDVKVSLGNFSQKFRRSTRRRYRMTTPLASAEPTPTRRALGRTPTKLYSPFGFVDSPRIAGRTPTTHKTPKRLQRPSTPRLNRKILMPVQNELAQAYSPNGAFQRDIQDMKRGFQELDILSRNISKRNILN